MKKSTSVAVTTVAAIGLSIACSSREQREGRVCVDNAQRVVSEDLCHQSSPTGAPYFWYYHTAYANGRYPAVGTMVNTGGRTASAVKAAPVARGGFGSTAGGRAAGA